MFIILICVLVCLDDVNDYDGADVKAQSLFQQFAAFVSFPALEYCLERVVEPFHNGSGTWTTDPET